MAKRFKLIPHFDKQTQKWVLNIPRIISTTGKRQRLFYDTETEALRESKHRKIIYAQYGVSLNLLSRPNQILAHECFKLLDEHQNKTGDKTSLQAITIAYIDKYNETHASISLDRLIDEYMEARSYRTPRYLRKFIYIKNKFAKFLKHKVSQIETEAIVDYLPPTTGARNSLIKHLSALFNFAIKKGYIPSKHNPIDAIERAHVPPQEVQILDSSVVEGMLNYAREHSPKLLPYLVLGFYTGARPNELTLLENRDLLFEEKLLVIRPEVSKTRKKRFPELPANAIAWLKMSKILTNLPNRKIVRLTEAQIIYARKQCYHAVVGDQPWVKTVMRHSYASHWLCLQIDQEKALDKLSINLGHTSTAISLKHYYAAVSKDDAAKYFEIWPK
jgi:integrase